MMLNNSNDYFKVTSNQIDFLFKLVHQIISFKNPWSFILINNNNPPGKKDWLKCISEKPKWMWYSCPWWVHVKFGHSANMNLTEVEMFVIPTKMWRDLKTQPRAKLYISFSHKVSICVEKLVKLINHMSQGSCLVSILVTIDRNTFPVSCDCIVM